MEHLLDLYRSYQLVIAHLSSQDPNNSAIPFLKTKAQVLEDSFWDLRANQVNFIELEEDFQLLPN